MTKLEEFANKCGFTGEYAEDFQEGIRSFVKLVRERALEHCERTNPCDDHTLVAFKEVVKEFELEEVMPKEKSNAKR